MRDKEQAHRWSMPGGDPLTSRQVLGEHTDCPRPHLDPDRQARIAHGFGKPCCASRLMSACAVFKALRSTGCGQCFYRILCLSLEAHPLISYQVSEVDQQITCPRTTKPASSVGRGGATL